jgi:hypothetical protein
MSMFAKSLPTLMYKNALKCQKPFFDILDRLGLNDADVEVVEVDGVALASNRGRQPEGRPRRDHHRQVGAQPHVRPEVFDLDSHWGCLFDVIFSFSP